VIFSKYIQEPLLSTLEFNSE